MTILKCSSSIKTDDTVKTPSKQQQKKKKKNNGNKVKKLKALLEYHKSLVVEKGLPPSNLMLQHAKEAYSLPPSQPEPKQATVLKCDKCNNTFTSKRKLKSHTKNAHKDFQKPEELCVEEADISLNLFCDVCDFSATSKTEINRHTRKQHEHIIQLDGNLSMNSTEVEETDSRDVVKVKDTGMAEILPVGSEPPPKVMHSSMGLGIDPKIQPPDPWGGIMVQYKFKDCVGEIYQII